MIKKTGSITLEIFSAFFRLPLNLATNSSYLNRRLAFGTVYKHVQHFDNYIAVNSAFTSSVEMNSMFNLVLRSYSNTVYLCAAGCVRSYSSMQCTVLRYTGVDQGREKMSFLLLQDSDLKPTTPSSPFF